MFDNLHEPDFSKLHEPPYFESDTLKMYHQGMVLYQTTLFKYTYRVNISANDYAIVYLDGKKIYTIDRSKNKA